MGKYELHLNLHQKKNLFPSIFSLSLSFSQKPKQNWKRKEENSEFNWRKTEANANPNWLIPCMHEMKTGTNWKSGVRVHVSAVVRGVPDRRESEALEEAERQRVENTRSHSSQISQELSNSVQFISVLTLEFTNATRSKVRRRECWVQRELRDHWRVGLLKCSVSYGIDSWLCY